MHYFISYIETFKATESFTEYSMISNNLISVHPLKWQIDTDNRLNKHDPAGQHETVLISWQPISDEDYETFHQPFKDNVGFRTALKVLKGSEGID